MTTLTDPSRPRWQAYARAPTVLRGRTLRSGVRGATASTYKLSHARPRRSCSREGVGPVQSRSRDHMRCKALQRRVFEPPYPARAPHVLMDHRRWCVRMASLSFIIWKGRNGREVSWRTVGRRARGPVIEAPARLTSTAPLESTSTGAARDRRPSQGAFARPAVVLRICTASSTEVETASTPSLGRQ